MQGKPIQVTLRVFKKRIKKQKKQQQQLFPAFKKWIFSINFIHDIDHSVTNYNKTSWNSIPDSNMFFCSDNLWYLFLLQVKECHQDWSCKTTKLGGFQHKISYWQLRHMTFFRRKRKTPDQPTPSTWKHSNARNPHEVILWDIFECRAYIYKVKFGRCSIFWECYLFISKPQLLH